jgi:hypothetical protein
VPAVRLAAMMTAQNLCTPRAGDGHEFACAFRLY